MYYAKGFIFCMQFREKLNNVPTLVHVVCTSTSKRSIKKIFLFYVKYTEFAVYGPQLKLGTLK